MHSLTDANQGQFLTNSDYSYFCLQLLHLSQHLHITQHHLICFVVHRFRPTLLVKQTIIILALKMFLVFLEGMWMPVCSTIL